MSGLNRQVIGVGATLAVEDWTPGKSCSVDVESAVTASVCRVNNVNCSTRCLRPATVSREAQQHQDSSGRVFDAYWHVELDVDAIWVLDGLCHGVPVRLYEGERTPCRLLYEF